MAKGYTHLTPADRESIENLLNSKCSLSDIARTLGKALSTISKEVKNHIVFRRTGNPGRAYNNCKNRFTCKRIHICNPCDSLRRHTFCKWCKFCNSRCSEYEADSCTRHQKPPYVCNGCWKHSQCTLEKRWYIASEAEKEYRETLSESRSGISFTEEELKRLDELISPLIRQNQSPHHICMNNRDALMVSERTIYNLIDSQLISAKNIDLPRKMRYKARKRKRRFKVDRSCRIGRDYACFKEYMEKNPDTAVVELDSVEGKKGGAVLLTIHFVKCEMMLAIRREANDAKSVTDTFRRILQELGLAQFQRLFPVLLADNGSEFSDPLSIEFSPEGERCTHLFYCDPNASYQKGSAERNHEFIRCFIPKGVDIGKYSQDDISLMMNHINSYTRESLGGKSP